VNIDREGIFKARLTTWAVKTFPNSQSVAVAIEFLIVSCLDGQEWSDWTSYGCVARGDFFVVKKDGTPNVKTVQDLAASIGWDGSLKQIASRPMNPPEAVVQVTVKEETYNGKSYFKVQWINPEDYTPNAGGVDASTASSLDARFGSLLRAAAGTKPTPKGQAPKKPAAQAPAPSPAPAPAAEVQDYGDIPF
jgi:hypothetical protein